MKDMKRRMRNEHYLYISSFLAAADIVIMVYGFFFDDPLIARVTMLGLAIVCLINATVMLDVVRSDDRHDFAHKSSVVNQSTSHSHQQN